MKKLQLLLLSGLILFAACSENDTEIEKEQPGETVSKLPTIIAKAEQNDNILKAGVVEDDDYTLGENFYWSNADQTVVLFADADNKYYRTDYAADVPDGVKSNTASFNFLSSEIMPDVTYTVHGFFPHDVWNFNQQDIKTPFLTANVPTVQTQSDATSAHLGSYMLLKAKKENVTLGSKPIELNYKHLSSVIRYAVWNASGNSSLKLTNINTKLASGKSVFSTSGSLANINDGFLSIPFGTETSSLTLRMEGSAQNFAEKNGKQQCEGYMAVLSTVYNAFDLADDLIIELSLTDGVDNYIIEKKYNVGTYLSFLSEGIKQGYSYYFQMKISPEDLAVTHAPQYAIGDLWPDAVSPHGIVFWLKPGSFGTKGKVMSLIEYNDLCWGPLVGKNKSME